MTHAQVVAPTDDGFTERLQWSWRFGEQVGGVLSEVPEIAAMAGPGTVRALLQQASQEQDLHLATDYTRLIVLPALCVSVRIRRFNQLRAYGREVVLRDSTPGGGRTEAAKILNDEHAADVMLYAFLNRNETRFLHWVLLDLNRLRAVWADPDRRARLGALSVNLSPGSRGLALGVETLRTARVVIRALLAEPTFYSLADAEAFLAGNSVYDALSRADQRSLARRFLDGTFQGQYYVGEPPLGREPAN